MCDACTVRGTVRGAHGSVNADFNQNMSAVHTLCMLTVRRQEGGARRSKQPVISLYYDLDLTFFTQLAQFKVYFHIYYIPPLCEMFLL